MLHTRFLAFISGLVAGGFLFARFFGLHEPVGLTLLPLSFQALLLLCGIGLGGVYPTARLWGPLGMSLGALPLPLYFGARPNFDSETVGFALFFWFTTVPAPLIGGVMSFLLSRKPIPRSIYVGIVASTLVVGAVAPPTVRGHELDAQHRSEVEQIGALLKGIHQAEISYRAGRSDRAFTCDGSELPGMSDLGYGWRSMGSYRKIENNPLQNFAESVGARWVKTNNYLLLRNGTQILLACSDQVRPRGFRAYGIPSFLPAPKFSIGENGELTVSGDSQGQANSVPEK